MPYTLCSSISIQQETLIAESDVLTRLGGKPIAITPAPSSAVAHNNGAGVRVTMTPSFAVNESRGIG